MTDKIRSFICLEISESARAEIARIQAELKRDPADITWTRPDGFHLTLHFLGEIEPAMLDPVAEAMKSAALSTGPFSLSLDCAGAFPNVKAPRVLWVGMRGDLEVLGKLASTLEDRLEAAGFNREARPFRPHLTLGRVKRPRGGEIVARHLMDAEFHPSSFRVSELVLMRSDLRPTGSRYTSLARVRLSG